MQVYPNPNSVYSVGIVAEFLGYHNNTIIRWTDKGILKAYRIGPRGDRRIRAVDIAYLLYGIEKPESAFEEYAANIAEELGKLERNRNQCIFQPVTTS